MFPCCQKVNIGQISWWDFWARNPKPYWSLYIVLPCYMIRWIVLCFSHVKGPSLQCEPCCTIVSNNVIHLQCQSCFSYSSGQKKFPFCFRFWLIVPPFALRVMLIAYVASAWPSILQAILKLLGVLQAIYKWFANSCVHCIAFGW